jgi:hypothetical protein
MGFFLASFVASFSGSYREEKFKVCFLRVVRQRGFYRQSFGYMYRSVGNAHWRGSVRCRIL